MPKKEPSAAPSPERKADVCGTCDDNGYVCSVCGHADGDCVCVDGPALERCPDCGSEA